MIWDCFDFEILVYEWIIQKHELPFQTAPLQLGQLVLGMLQPSDNSAVSTEYLLIRSPHELRYVGCRVPGPIPTQLDSIPMRWVVVSRLSREWFVMENDGKRLLEKIFCICPKWQIFGTEPYLLEHFRSYFQPQNFRLKQLYVAVFPRLHHSKPWLQGSDLGCSETWFPHPNSQIRKILEFPPKI